MARKLSIWIYNQKLITMKDFKKQYENAKKKAKEFMSLGQLSNYFDALLEMNYYKNLMVAVHAN